MYFHQFSRKEGTMKKRLLVLALAGVVICAPATIMSEDKEPVPTTEAKPTKEVKPTSEAKLTSVKVIDWKDLSKLLPEEIKGMEAGDLDGGTFTMADPTNPGQQLSYSFVEREFTAETKKGEGREITIRIMDCGLNQMMIAPFTMMMAYDSPDGSMKTTEIKDHKAWVIVEKDKGEIEGSQIAVLVAGHILVSVEGNELTTLEEMTKLAESIDYDKLAKLVK
jgi:hypothetical protein